MIAHPIEPVYDANSTVLILGSFPSIKSREAGFFYQHPQNRFWKVLAAVLEEPVPRTIPERRDLLLRHGIALWDVIESCDIHGSADSSITNVKPAKLERILERARIRQVFLNGRTAEIYFNRYLREQYGLEGVCLPSTSPANARWSLTKLVEAWFCVGEYTCETADNIRPCSSQGNAALAPGTEQ